VERFGTVTGLQQEGPPVGDVTELGGQASSLTGKDERGLGDESRFGRFELGWRGV